MPDFAFVALLFVCAIGLVSAQTSIRNYGQHNEFMCFAAQWNNGLNVRQIYPLKKAKSATSFHSASSYYSYSTPYGASANTPDFLEQSSVAQYFFFDANEQDFSGISLFFFFDKWRDTGGGDVDADITSTNLAGKGLTVLVRDDPGDDSYTWNDATGTSNPTWVWYPCCTDGFVVGNFPAPPTTSNFDPYTLQWCINLKFNSYAGVNTFKVRTLNDYWENGGSIIQDFNIAASDVDSLQLCYTQCSCPSEVRLTRNAGFLNNKQVVVGVGGFIGRYRPGSACSWIIDPVIGPEKIALYWREFRMALENDVVSIYPGEDDSSPVVARYPTGGASSDLDWSSALTSSLGATSTLYLYNSVVVPASEAYITFNAQASSPGAEGFTLQYYAVAKVDSITPDIISFGGQTTTVSGAYFNTQGDDQEGVSYLHTLPMCKFSLDGNDLYGPASFTSDSSVKCTIPAKSSFPNTTVNAGTVSVSNDGEYYDNEITFTYSDLDCSDFDNCGDCLNNDCGWCEEVAATGTCFVFPDGGDKSVVPGACPADDIDYIWHFDCCLQCHVDLNNCSGQGSCYCNETVGFRQDYWCQCSNTTDTAYINTDCSCECPLGTDDLICSGVPDATSVCDCNGGCNCDPELYEGDTCECLRCRGDLPCFGNGECHCNGTCTCDSGYSEESDCQCRDSCEPIDNPCYGNGECSCGTCTCDPGYDPLQNCQCVSPEACPTSLFGVPCSGFGSCSCNGTCECNAGYGGEDCSEQLPCTNNTCEDCGPIEYCSFCPGLQECIHDTDALQQSLCLAASNGTLYKNNECPEEVSIVDDPAPLPIVPIILAALAVALLLALSAIAAAYLLNKTGTSSVDDLETQFANFGTANPLFEAQTTTQSNPLYNS